ncbi:Hypothetical protein FSTVST1_343 [Faustovirus ST1]|nr:Hypothetical protein FSTVST1_343 [Faustovirus ST1]
MAYNRELVDFLHKQLTAHNNRSYYGKVKICAQVLGITMLIVGLIAILALFVCIISTKTHVHNRQPAKTYVLGFEYYEANATDIYISRVNFNASMTFWSLMTLIVVILGVIVTSFTLHYADGRYRKYEKTLFNVKDE